MTAKIIRFTGVTILDLDPNLLLEEAKGKLEGVVIIGFMADGTEYFASSVADGADVIWHLERAKHKLMRLVDEQTEST